MLGESAKEQMTQVDINHNIFLNDGHFSVYKISNFLKKSQGKILWADGPNCGSSGFDVSRLKPSYQDKAFC